MQRLVDFVVDTIAVNAARAASLKCVPPILRAALCKLETLLSHKLHITIDNKVESEIEADVENVCDGQFSDSFYFSYLILIINIHVWSL